MAKKILTVDDEEFILEMMKSRLEANGYTVIQASEGQTGLQLARSEKPDLIILDLMLPKLDGYRVCRLLKFDDNFKHVPILILTARIQEEDRKLALEAGADAYDTKPFDPQKLLAKIKELLKEPA
jgi:DNA-binding response OmpR family regulator